MASRRAPLSQDREVGRLPFPGSWGARQGARKGEFPVPLFLARPLFFPHILSGQNGSGWPTGVPTFSPFIGLDQADPGAWAAPESNLCSPRPPRTSLFLLEVDPVGSLGYLPRACWVRKDGCTCTQVPPRGRGV